MVLTLTCVDFADTCPPQPQFPNYKMEIVIPFSVGRCKDEIN